MWTGQAINRKRNANDVFCVWNNLCNDNWIYGYDKICSPDKKIQRQNMIFNSVGGISSKSAFLKTMRRRSYKEFTSSKVPLFIAIWRLWGPIFIISKHALGKKCSMNPKSVMKTKYRGAHCKVNGPRHSWISQVFIHNNLLFKENVIDVQTRNPYGDTTATHRM